MAELTLDKDFVRLLISDVGGTSGDDFIFSDDEIEAYLVLDSSIFGAAALALRTIAANEALVQKRITFLEMKTDGALLAKELGDLADKLEKKAEEDGGDVTIIEIVAENFALRQDRARYIY